MSMPNGKVLGVVQRRTPECRQAGSMTGAVCWRHQDGDVVGKAKMEVKHSSVRTLNVSVYTVLSITSPCRNGDVLVKTGRSVHQFHMIKVPSNHLERLRVLCLQQAYGVM
ncbi:hypothetical protein ATANTOWER_007753 [Ataeniobius toweri]|uniref:Uncharacterized protein n=1 Tax=Ataeniobius toweri TaxID=208326 RepID=A0ABU7CIN1_9TELE|nr:hypothetical protein [Ataeniobius toweri]